MALVDRYAGIIFDYGGVLAFHQTPADAAQLAGVAGMPVELFEKSYWTGRAAYDKGLVTAEDYWDGIAQQAGKPFTAAQLKELIEIDTISWTHFDHLMYLFVDELIQQGKRVAVLSNMPRELGETIKAANRGFAPFHQVTLSYEVRSVKPEPDIYQHCLAGLGVAPQEALFLDDRIENIKGAQALGIEGIQFTSRDEVLPRLKA